MTKLGIRRRDKRRILHATNVNTTLRSFDALLIDAACAATHHLREVNGGEAAPASEIHAGIQSPSSLVGWFGVERYKKIDILADLLTADHPADVFLTMTAYLRCVCSRIPP